MILCMYVYIYMYMCVCVCIYVWICVCMCIYIYVCVCVCNTPNININNISQRGIEPTIINISIKYITNPFYILQKIQSCHRPIQSCHRPIQSKYLYHQILKLPNSEDFHKCVLIFLFFILLYFYYYTITPNKYYYRLPINTNVIIIIGKYQNIIGIRVQTPRVKSSRY